MLAAAGIVVTEIRTPISAPDLAVDSDSIPATPAQAATKNEKKSGLEMMSAIEPFLPMKSSGGSPDALKSRAARKTAVMAAGRPTARAVNDLAATSRRIVATATQNPATGPNSGPTTIAPTIRIGESR